MAHALIFTAVYSRHMFVWLSHSQTLATVIDGCEAAWAHFGGVFRVLIPDNLSPVIADADPVNPRFTDGWLDYAQARGFQHRPGPGAPAEGQAAGGAGGAVRAGQLLPPARHFLDLADAQRRVEFWCATTAGLRMHGTNAQRPAELFAAHEADPAAPSPAGPL